MKISTFKSVLLVMTTGILLIPLAYSWDFMTAKEDGGKLGTLMEYSASARALSMGRAQVAVTEDASATFWNPAGLAHIDRGNIVATYSMAEEDTEFGFLSIGQPMYKVGTIGMSLGTLRSGNFEKRGESGENLGSTDMSESGLILSHALKIKKKYAFGTSLKMVRHQIDTFTDTGYGLDIGIQGRMSHRWGWGFKQQNLMTPKIQ